MASTPLIIRPPVFLPTPLVYNDSIDTTNMTNVVLIDSNVANDKQFYDSANANTFPIIYNYNSSIDELLALLRRKFPASSIQRIALIFHDKGTNFMTKFMNDKLLFEESDLEENQTSFTENVSFLIGCINEFHVVNIDFLACNTLQYSNWKSYYALLAAQTSAVVGASNNETGNINYGGDWVMENTSENVRDMYFTSSIADYASTLALTTISLNGANGNVGLRMISGVIQYFDTTTSIWTPIGSGNWPVQFNNSNLSSTLNIVATENLTITGSYGGTSGFFIAGTNKITFDGSGNTLTLNTITGYPGFISTSYNYPYSGNIIVQNFTTATIGGSTLASVAGWLCQSNFGIGTSGNQIIGCTNTGDVNALNAGGITGGQNGASGGSVSVTNCTNSGAVSGEGGGGIAGFSAGNSGTATFTNCTNTGNISGQYAGGIAASYTGYNGGSVGFTNCTNTGNISGQYAGGIAGYGVGNGNNNPTLATLATFTSCTNTGAVDGNDTGGIAGSSTASDSGSATIANCINTGDINGEKAGGIVGSDFGRNTITTSSISNCYSIGSINGDSAGGIVGGNIGNTSNPVINISNSYSLGDIATTCGGICGGVPFVFPPYSGTPTINITNCYSWGAITGTGSGIVATSLQSSSATINQNNIYVANGSWSDASANAVGALTGFPTDISTNNPGTTWTTIASNTPYVLSLYNAQLYSPYSASSSSNYTTSAGLFTDTSYNYQIVYNNQVSNVATTRVFVAKGTPSPYYYSYNNNTFTFTNTGTATDIINATITPSNGEITYSMSPICFKEGTKILCENDLYIPIEELKIGDLVKTYKHGYQKVIMIAHTDLLDYSQNMRNQLYTYSREKNPDLIEDLHLTGGHSLLVDALTEEESTHMQKIKWSNDGRMVEDKYKLLACFSHDICIATEQNVEIYHFTLEPPENAKSNHVYGIYANGILAESCSKGAMEKTCKKK